MNRVKKPGKPSIYPLEFIKTQGTIIERFADSAFYATLPNGKKTVAFLEKKQMFLNDKITHGDKVALTICPSDFNRARIDAIEGIEGIEA
ncbi:MAG: hypothetical protein RR719_03050 [Akkermansia sp.]